MTSDVNRFDLAQYMNQWLAFVMTAMNLQDPQYISQKIQFLATV
jgi:hypothetical protein